MSIEVVVIAAALLTYFGVRGLTEGSEVRAFENGYDVYRLEEKLSLDFENELQDLIIGHDVLVTFSNWVYIYGHWPVILISALWLFAKRPDTYYMFRNAFLLSGALGLVVFVSYPCAPPRLLDLGLVDTVTVRSESYRVLQPPGFTNQYAAMPSLHFGWNLLLAVGLFLESRVLLVRAFAVVLPTLMAFAVVMTANHLVLDAIAGAGLAMVALVVLWLSWPRLTRARGLAQVLHWTPRCLLAERCGSGPLSDSRPRTTRRPAKFPRVPVTTVA
jgi:membrane-associated phospholipid phosphatase